MIYMLAKFYTEYHISGDIMQHIPNIRCYIGQCFKTQFKYSLGPRASSEYSEHSASTRLDLGIIIF